LIEFQVETLDTRRRLTR